jgi:hypothetical protein
MSQSHSWHTGTYHRRQCQGIIDDSSTNEGPDFINQTIGV